MLKIKEEKAYSDFVVEFDGYIPLNIDFESTPGLLPLYWRGGDGRFTLLEIGLDRQSGKVRNITLSSINVDKVNRVNQKFLLPDVSFEKGALPVFDLPQWCESDKARDFSTNFIDEFDLDLNLELGENYMSLSIVGREAVRYIRHRNIRFGIDSDDLLSSIDVLDMSVINVELLMTSIEKENQEASQLKS